jgi:hypothetical protein
MASFLFGLSAYDPLVLSIVPCIMVLVILLACWLPARRATRIDPMENAGQTDSVSRVCPELPYDETLSRTCIYNHLRLVKFPPPLELSRRPMTHGREY